MAQGQRIPEEAIDQVLASVSIVEVVKARGIALKNSGREQVGLCPFHDDTHASMSLYTAHGIGRFKCFSCGAAGHAIKFVMAHDGVDFRTAVADLAQMGGVDVPELHGQDARPMSEGDRAELERKRAAAAERRQRAEIEERMQREQAEQVANRVFDNAGVDAGDGLAARYLQGRGIDTTAAWPAGFCADLRGGEDLLDFGVGSVGDNKTWFEAYGTMLVGLLRDARGRPVGVQRIYLDTSGDAVRKRGGDRPDKMTLGTASGACVRLSEADPLDMPSPRLVLTEGIETGAAVMAALYGAPVWAALSTSGLRSFELPDELRGKLHSVVIAADLDRSQAGELAARACAARIKEQSPATMVRIALPRCDMAPGLFDAQGEPRGKSVDWLDVSLEAGPGVVSEAMDGVVEWRGEVGDGDRADAGEPAVGDDGRGGRGVPSANTAEGDGDDWPVVFAHDDHAAFARQVLMDEYAPPEDERPGSRWLLAWYQDKWYRRLPGESRWREDDEKRVHAQVWQRLRTYKVVKRNVPKPLTPTAQTVRGVLEALIVECGVFAGSLPAWAPCTLDGQGEPLWGVSAHVYDDLAGSIDPRSAVATRSGIIDADAWAEGTLRVEPLTPLWFSTGTLPHELPLDAMQSAIDDDACLDGVEGAELYGRLCPTWLEFLRDITEPYSSGGGEVDDAEKWIMGMQEWFGYLLTHDTRYETIGLMTGPTRSGKGTVQSALRSILGPGQVASSTFQELASRWKPLELVDKPVCIMPDASIGRFTDAVACAERLKNIRGGDPLSIEKHGHGYVGAVVLPTRVMIFVNELPKLPDSAGALAGSMVNWPTAKSFEGKEDRGLKARIVAEAAGILVWALFGLRRLRKQGVFTRCQAGEAVLDEMRSLGSPVYTFVAEECVRGVKQGVAVSVLYEIYCKWAEAEGHGQLGKDRFGVQLRTVVPELTKRKLTASEGGGRQNVYMGLRPVSVGDDNAEMVVERMEQVRPPQGGQGGLPIDDWARDR